MHDSLVTLAKQMIRVKEQGRTEAKGFLTWLGEHLLSFQ